MARSSVVHRVFLAVTLLGLGGCNLPELEGMEPKPLSAEEVSERIKVAEAESLPIETAVPEPELPALPVSEEIVIYAQPEIIEPLVSPDSRRLIIDFEVSSPSRYERSYSRPICPLCLSTASGVTIGIGYDFGHTTTAAARVDWSEHDSLDELLPAVGLSGQEAINMARELNHVYTSFNYAEIVFDKTSVVKYYRIAARSFGPEFINLNWHARGALVSLVYNRGGSMGVATSGVTKDSRWEMRVIRDRCIPYHDYECIKQALMDMRRLWKSIPGLQRRRVAEAEMAVRTEPTFH